MALLVLSVLWLAAGAVCLISPARELMLGIVAAGIGVLFAVYGLQPTLRLRGAQLTRGWPYRWSCDLNRLATAEASFIYQRGQKIGVRVKVGDVNGGTAKVRCPVDVPADALGRAVVDHILAAGVGLRVDERDTLHAISQGRPLVRRHVFLVEVCVAVVVLAGTGLVARGVASDLTLRREGRPVTLTVTSVAVQTSPHGDQSETICLTPSSDTTGSDHPCIDMMGVTALHAGEVVAAHEDPTNPNRLALDSLPPSDLGFLTWLAAVSLTLLLATPYYWRRRRPSVPGT